MLKLFFTSRLVFLSCITISGKEQRQRKQQQRQQQQQQQRQQQQRQQRQQQQQQQQSSCMIIFAEKADVSVCFTKQKSQILSDSFIV